MSGLYTMLSLGSFNFGLDTAVYQELKRSAEYIWASQNRFGSAPAVQFVGFGDETISLPGVIYPEWNGGTGQLDDLRALAEESTPQTLIDGRGNVLGEWVIERVDEGQANFAQAGVARRQEFTLTLKKYGDVEAARPLESSGSLVAAAGYSALPAVPKTLSITSSIGSIISTVTGTANATLSTATRLSSAVSASLNQVGSAAAALGIHSPLITAALKKSQTVTNSLRTSASGGLDLLRRVQSVTSASSAVGGIYDQARALTQPAAAASASIASSLKALTASGASSATLGIVTGALTSANKVTVLASGVSDTTNTILKQLGG